MTARAATSAGIHTSSASNEWLTPPEVACVLDRIGVGLDPCWAPGTLFCSLVHIDCRWKEDGDGLAHDWTEIATNLCEPTPLTFVNPPYSDLASWLGKCYLESESGIPIIALVPARLETEGFQNFVIGVERASMLAISKRLTYHHVREDGTVGPKLGTNKQGKTIVLPSTFSSVLIGWNAEEFLREFDHLGKRVRW